MGRVVMGLFDAFKKKKEAKAPLKELETPPPADMGSPSFSQMDQTPAPPSDMRIAPMSFSEQVQPQQMQQEMQSPSGVSHYEDIPIPEPEEFSAPTQQMMQPHQMQPLPQMQAFQQMQMPQQFPPQLKMGSPVPTFRFYQEAVPQHEEVHQEHEELHTIEVPFDVSQELLSMPEMLKQHEEEKKVMQKPIPTFEKFEKIEKKQFVSAGSHIGKQFITMGVLYDVGEQLVNMAEDLALAKDTAFRLTDLNEQEIEIMAKWQTLQQNMELRLAEMDKILFKA